MSNDRRSTTVIRRAAHCRVEVAAAAFGVTAERGTLWPIADADMLPRRRQPRNMRSSIGRSVGVAEIVVRVIRGRRRTEPGNILPVGTSVGRVATIGLSQKISK